jgi:hypothetical protein
VTPEKIEDAIALATLYLSEWMPQINASKLEQERTIFDTAGMLVCDDPSLINNDPFVELRMLGLRRMLVSQAIHGSRPHHEALCEVATVLHKRGDSLPVWLQEYVIFAAIIGGGRSKRGRKSQNTRDTAIAWVIYSITRASGLHPTRNPGAANRQAAACGCSIVVDALKRHNIHMSEANVAAIWRRRGRSMKEMHAAGPSMLLLTERWRQLVRPSN